MPPPRTCLWIAFIIYWIALTILTHLPLQRMIPPEHHGYFVLFDKVHHIAAFAVLTGLLAPACWLTFPTRHWLLVGVLVALAGSAWGAIDERTQEWVRREARLDDWVADVIGAFLGVLLAAGIRAWRLRSRRARGFDVMPMSHRP